MEEDQNSEELEVTPQDQESTVVEEQSQVDVQENPQSEEKGDQDKNWRQLRRKAEESEKQLKLYEEKVKMQEELIRNFLSQTKPSQQTQQRTIEVDEFADLPADEYLPYGQTRKLVQKDARTIAREEYLAMEKEREAERFKERLKAQYSDFDDVVNSETIALLEQREPELAATIADLKDPYKMGLQTYKFITSMGLVMSADERRHAKEVQKKIEHNENNIQSPQAFNKRPMAQAFSTAQMNKDEKQKLYEEMLGYASQSPGY